MQDSQSATYMVANLAVVTRRRKHIAQSVSGCSTVMTKPERTRRKKSRFLQKKMVQSEDITSNTFDAFDEALSDQFWVEVKPYNELLNRGSDETSCSQAPRRFLYKPPFVR